MILAGIQASLEARADCEVLAIDPTQETRLEAFRSLCPATIIFDLGETRMDVLLPLLQLPGLLLIGIDPETHQALVWSEMQLPEPNTQELVQAIARYTASKAGSARPAQRDPQTKQQ